VDPQLRVTRGGWVASGDGLSVTAACGQEALLLLAVERHRHGLPPVISAEAVGERLNGERLRLLRLRAR
jgi:hypothetical protein